MRTWLPRFALAATLFVGSCAACTMLLPEEYAVNAPLGQLLFGWGGGPLSDEDVARKIQVAPGFSVGRYADVPRARFLLATEAGDLLVSVGQTGEILLLERDRNGDGLPDAQRVLLEDLDRPHGMDLHDGWLYIGETGRVRRIRFDVEAGATQGSPEVVVASLPEGGNHWTRTVRIGPDRKLYVTVGSSCNVCFEEDERRAAMLRFELDGTGGGLYARGLRNAVGFDWHPESGALYATDNGRDLLGDDFPPCELNEVIEGGDYGWPVANGDRVPDPDLGAGEDARIEASIPPAHPFRAHNAPLGIRFLRGDELPEGYRHAGLVALHGSWNRTSKDGYKVVSLHTQADGSFEERDFLWGFLEGEDVIGRPVDVTEATDGAIFVSDDYAGAIYRVVVGEGAVDADAAPKALLGPTLASLPEAERERASQAGRTIFLENDCVTCHEPALVADGVVVVELKDLATRYDVPGIEAFLATPTPPMPSYPFTAEQRRQLGVFLLETY